MPLDSQDIHPFDALPNELLVKIFARALAGSSLGKDASDGEKSLSRGLLSHVCRRWKYILQAHVCIGVPDDRRLPLSKDTLESGELTSRIYSIAQFAGPVNLTVTFDMDFKERTWLGEFPSLLSSFAVALGAPHCATIILNLCFFPLEVLEVLITGSGCQTFARINSLSISHPTSHPTQRTAAFTLHPIATRFPLLSHLSLLDTEGRPPLSLQSNLWVWLFQPSICADLLSLSVTPIRPDDLSWLLLRMPRLLDLRVSGIDKTLPFSDTQSVIMHENVKQLSLGFGYSGSFIRCPKLTTLISPYRGVDGRSTSINCDPKVKLTTLNHRFTNSPTTDLASYCLDLSFLSHLCIILVTDDAFARVVDIIGRGFLPSLSHLSLRLSPPRGGYFATTPSSIAPLAHTANHLHQLTRPRASHPGLNTIDCRTHRRDKNTASALFYMVKLIRQAHHHDSVALNPEADFDQFCDTAYSGLKSIKTFLDAPSPEVDLRGVSEGWTVLVKGMEKIIAPGVPAYELLTTFPAFWDIFERLKVVFIGSPFELHEDIIYRWKAAGELTRQSWTSAKKQWRIGAALDSLHWQFEGIYWGRQGDSLIYDLREEDRYYFADSYDDLIFDHSTNGYLAGYPSPEVLRSLKLQS